MTLENRQYSALFEPGAIGGLQLQNRIIMAPMGNSLADENGMVTDAMLAYYRARARGGAGLIITQFVSVNREDKMPYSLALYDDSFIAGLADLVRIVHEEGSKISIQMMHPGLLMNLLPSLPTDITIKVPSVTPMMPAGRPYRIIGEEDIRGYVDDFAGVARRIVATGADALEIHACHGCLLSSFLSPVTNRRQDRYGGSAENRLRFTLEVVAAVRREIGREFPLSVRINGNDDFPGGVTPDDVVSTAVALERAGVDAVSISAGLEYWTTLMAPPWSTPQGVNISVAAKVKSAVGIPVVTAGKITPELAEDVVREEKSDFIAMGRPLLADPGLPEKLKNRRADDICRCVYCNNCLKMTWRSCTVNPFLYRETMLPLPPAAVSKKVMVIGGGIAGMEASMLLAEQGHRVSLYEKSDKLGGQWRVASNLPEKSSYIPFITYLENRLSRLGVSVTLGTEVARETVRTEAPDAVVVATGATPKRNDIPGIGANIVQANDVIDETCGVKGPAVVIGGAMLALETAAYLADTGVEVMLVSHGRLGGRRGPDDQISFRALMQKLVEKRVPMFPGTKIVEVTPGWLIIEIEKELVGLPAETIVVATGVSSVSVLVDELTGTVPAIFPIGDCVVPGSAAQATYSAARLTREI